MSIITFILYINLILVMDLALQSFTQPRPRPQNNDFQQRNNTNPSSFRSPKTSPNSYTSPARQNNQQGPPRQYNNNQQFNNQDQGYNNRGRQYNYQQDNQVQQQPQGYVQPRSFPANYPNRNTAPPPPPQPYQNQRHRSPDYIQNNQEERSGGYNQNRGRGRPSPRGNYQQQTQQQSGYRNQQRGYQRRDDGRDMRENEKRGMDRQGQDNRNMGNNQQRQQNNRTEQNRFNQRNQGGFQRGRGRGNDRGRGRGAPRGRGSHYQQNRNAPNLRNQQPRAQKKAVARQQSEQQSQEMRQISQQQYESSGEQEVQQQVSFQSQNQKQDLQQPQEQSLQASNSVQQQQQQQEQQQQQQEQSAGQSQGSIGLQRIDSMCSQSQFNQRVQTFTLNNRNQAANIRVDTGRSFAIFQINKRTNQPDYALTLKRFRRSTNRAQGNQQKDQQQDLPRSRKGLIKTMNHIHKQIIDSDSMSLRDLAFPPPPGQDKIQFLHIYDFLWNRMRQMIKDVSRLDLSSRYSKNIIILCEEMLRFFIIAVREGRLHYECRLEFDAKMNLQAITKILTQLLEIYESQRTQMMKQSQQNGKEIYVSPNQPQIIAYAIIISQDIQNTLNQKLMIKLDGMGIDHPLVASQEIQLALTIKKALRNRDYQTYYRILQSQKTQYVLSCLMLHHLPIIRQQTLRIMYRMSIQLDPSSKIKGKRIPQAAFKYALRFKNSQSVQYKKCLQKIGAYSLMQGEQSCVILTKIQDSVLDNQWILRYQFNHNKLERSRYGNPGCSKRLLNSNLMSRQQLLKRNWNSSSYPQKVKKYYAQQETSDVEQLVIERPVVSRQPQISSQVVATQQTKAPTNNLSFLLAKKKQFQRAKFLKGLQSLVQKLIKNSDIHCMHKRKKGLQTIFQLVDYMRIVMLSSCFNHIIINNQSKILTQDVFKTINHYAEIRKEFGKAYNKNGYQFQKEKEVLSGKMSDLLKSNPVRKKSYNKNCLYQLFKIHKNNIQNKKQKRLNLLVFFISNSKQTLSPSQVRFIGKLYAYFAQSKNHSPQSLESQGREIAQGRGKMSVSYEKKIVQKDNQGHSIDYKLTLVHYKQHRTNQIPFISGHDSIIFIDLWNNVQPFRALIKQVTNYKKKIVQQNNLSQNSNNFDASCNVLHVASQSPQWKIDPQQYYVKEINQSQQMNFDSSWHSLQTQSICLTPAFRLSMLRFLSQPLSRPFKQQKQLQIYQISNLLQQIQNNLLCIPQDILTGSQYKLQFIEQYFNLCLEHIRQGVIETFHQYDSFEWSEILLEANYLKRGPKKYMKFSIPDEYIIMSQQKICLNQLLRDKFAYSFNLLQMLKIKITTRYQQLMKSSVERQALFIFAQSVQEYITLLNGNDTLDDQNIIDSIMQCNPDLKFEQTAIVGNCYGLFEFVIQKLKQRLNCLNIILPKDFRFRLKKQSFTCILTKKRSLQQVQLNLSDQSLKDFKYSRANLMAKLQNELAQFQQHWANGRKMVKFD